MILIENILVSEEVLDKKFACDLGKCKGACCWEGDLGAPIDEEEIELMKDALPRISHFLDAESRAIIEEVGVYLTEGEEEYVTPLKQDESCVFLVGEKGSHARCAFELAYEKGDIEFQKPISCHLYPIRIHQNKKIDFQSLNYDEWDICSKALVRGEKEEIELVDFVKDALVRKYGLDFYEQLRDGMQQYGGSDNSIQ